MDKEYLIEKWLADELTPAEMEEFQALDDYALNKAIIEGVAHFKADQFSKVADFSELEERLPSQATQPKVRTLHWTKPLLRVAAVAVIAIGLYFTLFYNTTTRVETLAAEKVTVELPDESVVTLNALSEISFNKRNWDEKREVQLNGEAFFDVAKGAIFDVITEDGLVRVVGTEFNVKQRDGYFEVKCFEGVVRVSALDTDKELRVGDTYRLYNGEITFDEISGDEPTWTQNVSTFSRVNMTEVISELERQYNITVVFDDVNTDRLFTGGFVHNNLENALNSITEPMDLTYEMESSNLVRLKN